MTKKQIQRIIKQTQREFPLYLFPCCELCGQKAYLVHHHFEPYEVDYFIVACQKCHAPFHDWGGEKFLKPIITIRRNGSFYINPALIKAIGIKNKFLKLGYSARNKSIIFWFNKECTTPKTCRLNKNGKGSVINSSMFFKAYNLDINKFVGKYLPEKETHDILGKFWYIDLNKKL